MDEAKDEVATGSKRDETASDLEVATEARCLKKIRIDDDADQNFEEDLLLNDDENLILINGDGLGAESINEDYELGTINDSEMLQSIIKTFESDDLSLDILEETDYDIEISNFYHQDTGAHASYKQDCEILKTIFESCKLDALKDKDDLISRMFFVNLPYLQAVETRKVPSKKFDDYCMHEAHGGSNFSSIFSANNNQLFIKLISENFSKNDSEARQKLDLHLKVFLPELQTKIVMDVYKISNKKEAVKKSVELAYNILIKN